MDEPVNPETTRLLATTDWAASPLGPYAAWPTELKTLANLMVRSRSPQHIVWGEAQVLLYNDGYIPVLGDRHPAAFGRPFRDVWPDIWAGVEPIVRMTYSGVSSAFENHPWLLDRGDHQQQVWISFAYTPVVDDAGRVLGFHCTFHETTAAVLAEQERARELDRLRAMFEQAPGFIALLTGPAHVFTLANDAYRRLVGGREVLGRPVSEAFPEAVGQGFVTLLDRVYATGEPFVGSRIPLDLDDANGIAERRYMDFVYQPMRDAEGRVAGIFVEGADVTAHCRAEEELRAIGESMAAAARTAEDDRALLDAMLQAAPVGIGYATVDGRLQLVNQANIDLWGHVPSTRSVDDYDRWKAWWADGSPRHGERVQAQEWGLARALAGEDVAGDVIEIEPFDMPGARRTVLLRATPVRGAAGEVTGAVVAQVDITDRVAAEARLRESEARFRTIADAMPQMVWSTRADGHADYFNRQWCEFTGEPAHASEGLGWLDVLHPDDRAPSRERWLRSAESGALYEAEYRMRHHSGEYRWVLGRGLPVRDDAGAITRWMGTCTDIHEHKLSRAALEQNDAALRLADRRKDEFLAMLAHELRNPLAPIRTAADIIAMPRTTLDGARQAGAVIARQVGHMTELVDDLLDVSRVTRGQVALERRVFDLRDAVRGAVEQVRPLAEARSLSLAVRVGATPLWVDGDRTRLTQVVGNLLNNAAKYTPPGGSIAVDVRVSGAQACVAVRDDGLGIEPDLLPHVFELFTQGARTLDRAQGGLGIGLALVHGLVALHGGSVHASSDGAGLGSRFVVELPLVDAGESAPHDEAQARRDAAPGDPLRVVVVDDNRDAASTLALLLQGVGHRVDTFDSAEALLDAAPADVDAYVLDIGLPVMNGLELARVLRASCAKPTLLVAVSGYGRDGDLDASREAGFDVHLVKPVEAARLLAALADAEARRAVAKARES
jgi:PAS domain S-box-containing protein